MASGSCNLKLCNSEVKAPCFTNANILFLPSSNISVFNANGKLLFETIFFLFQLLLAKTMYAVWLISFCHDGIACVISHGITGLHVQCHNPQLSSYNKTFCKGSNKNVGPSGPFLLNLQNLKVAYNDL